MEPSSFENLRRFFDRVKSAGFFTRLFFWKPIVSAGYDAFSEFRQLQDQLQEQDRRIREITAESRERSLTSDHQKEQIIQLQQDILALKTKNEDLVRKASERENEAGVLAGEKKKNREIIERLNADIAVLSARYDQLNAQYTESATALSRLRQADEERTREHDARVAGLTTLKTQLEQDRLRVQAEREAEVRREFLEMEQTWRRHEEEVEATLRAICQRHTIGYCGREQFPYAGKPDNAVVIAGQYVIFDAKSPKNPEELGNFPQYIRAQAEAVKKYVKGEDVKNEVFLVVPANTVEYLSDFYYDMADWQVYVVTHDCIEPILLALRKVEDYEFAGQLDPEDRDNLCRVIGKFAHAAKRRIQIDTYFSNEFIDLLQSCDHLLPDEFRQKVVEYEMAEKMNPPVEKRKKKIPIRELEHDVKVIGKEAEAREIDTTAVTKEKIETITLHKFLE